MEARVALLAEEKALSKATVALAKKRAALPWREISKDYEFVGSTGTTKLSSMFGQDQNQLIVYHMMMGKGNASNLLAFSDYSGLLSSLFFFSNPIFYTI